MSKQIKITKADFRKWLHRKPAQERCFVYFDGKNCAVASFLKEFHAVEDPRIDGYRWGVGDENQLRHPIPNWLLDLISRVNTTINTTRITRLSDLRKAMR